MSQSDYLLHAAHTLCRREFSNAYRLHGSHTLQLTCSLETLSGVMCFMYELCVLVNLHFETSALHSVHRDFRLLLTTNS
jgi:hypothetical protein